jgi:hypothetical protein
MFEQLNSAILFAIFSVQVRRVRGEHVHIPDSAGTLAQAGHRFEHLSSETAIVYPESFQGRLHLPRIGSKIVHLIGSGLG